MVFFRTRPRHHIHDRSAAVAKLRAEIRAGS
jgi:hypothetical protein